MTIPRSGSGIHPNGKQNASQDSWAENARRQNAMQSDLIAIVTAFGLSRSLLQRRGPWDEACRNPKEFEPNRPYRREDEMIVDVVRTVANRGTHIEQSAVRKAVTQYFQTRCDLALEFLGEPEAECVLELSRDLTKEIGEAQCATLTAVATKCPEAYDRAARENTEVLSAAERVRDGFRKAAQRMRRSTPVRVWS